MHGCDVPDSLRSRARVALAPKRANDSTAPGAVRFVRSVQMVEVGLDPAATRSPEADGHPRPRPRDRRRRRYWQLR